MTKYLRLMALKNYPKDFSKENIKIRVKIPTLATHVRPMLKPAR